MTDTATEASNTSVTPNVAVSQPESSAAVNHTDQSNDQSNDTIAKINAIKASLESQLTLQESSTSDDVTSQNSQELLNMLNQLDSFTSSINQSILASTQIGITVNKINKMKPPPSAEVKDKAKSIVAAWKTIVASKSASQSTQSATRTLSKTDNNSSRTPSPPSPSPTKAATPVKPASSSQPSKVSATSTNTTAAASSAVKRKTPSSVDTKSSDKDSATAKRSKTDNQPTTPASKPAAPNTPVASSPKQKDGGSGEFRLCKTGNETRNKIQKLLFDAIGGSSGDWEVELACRIEAAMWSQHKDTNSAYKTKYRELAMNLKDPANPDVNDALLTGAWTPEQVVSMSSKDLASQSLKEQREKDAKWEMAAARSDLGKLNGLTDMFRCGKCKERKCTYYQMQTRSADEPMTVFVRCTVCGNRWKC